MSAITLKVNGQRHTVDVDPATPLLYVLGDDLRLSGPKFGCGVGQCGACTVLAGGRAVRSCVTQVRVALPFTIAVHAPHCDSPQPNFGPRSCRSSLRTYSSGVAGSTSTVCL